MEKFKKNFGQIKGAFERRKSYNNKHSSFMSILPIAKFLKILTEFGNDINVLESSVVNGNLSRNNT